MHILIISSEPYQYPESPLLGVFQKDQVNSLRDRGHKVGVISPAGRSLRYIKNKNIFKKFKDKNVLRRKSFDFLFKFKILQQFDFCFFGIRQYNNYVKLYGKPDIIHAHNSLHAGKLALKLKKIYDQKYVITEHSSWVARGHYKGYFANQISSIYKQSDALIAVSSYLSKQIQKYYADVPIYIVGNILDDLFIDNPLKFSNSVVNKAFYDNSEFLSSKIESQPIRLLSVGSLDSNKNQSLLIDAHAYLKKKNIVVETLIIGSGPDENFLKEKVYKLGLTDSITFLGRVPRSDVKFHLQNTDILCITSYVETFGVVAIEANACNVPVVTTQCGGPCDIIVDSRCGIVVDGFGVEEYSSAIISLYKSPLKSNALAKNTQERYGRKSIAMQLEDIYLKRK